MTKQLRLTDVSAMARTGFRGVNAAAFLQAQGLALPLAPNQAVTQADTSVVLRLSQREFWILAPGLEQVSRLAALDDEPTGEGCYRLFCRDSHNWYVLAGEARAACMARLCGVDLRAPAFPQGSIAQTSVARMNAIIVHHELAGEPVFSLLCDSAAGEYFQGTIADAMGEF